MRKLAKTFVCLNCGAAFEIRRWLEAHWATLKHGPADVQAAAIARARGK